MKLRKPITAIFCLVAFCAISGISAGLSQTYGTPAPSPSSAATTTVHIRNSTFTPDNLTVHVGDTVTFMNDDSVTHNVTGDPLNSGDIASGKSWQYTFTKAGTYKYICTHHANMVGSITVVAAQ